MGFGDIVNKAKQAVQKDPGLADKAGEAVKKVIPGDKEDKIVDTAVSKAKGAAGGSTNQQPPANQQGGQEPTPQD